MINILIRTSNRPELFKRCVDSIKSQTYKDIRIIVGIDSDKAKGYTQGFETYWMLRKDLPFFYNDYCNQLKSLDFQGWYFFLDDDDFLDNPFVIENMIPHLEEDKAIICQYRRRGRPKPPNWQMDERVIARGWIGLPSIWLHSKHKDLAQVQGLVDYDDYNYIQEVSQVLATKFIKEVVVCCDRRSWGKI